MCSDGRDEDSNGHRAVILALLNFALSSMHKRDPIVMSGSGVRTGLALGREGANGVIAW